MNPARLINQTAGPDACDYFTPRPIILAAEMTMGEIDLDPASCHEANAIVRAARIFTKEDNGLLQEWHGNVFMNHPFSRNGNVLWIRKLLDEVASRHVHQACCITYACTSERWFQPLLKEIQCYLYPRTNYLLPNGEVKRGVTKGSVVTYFGPRHQKFREAFSALGTVKL